MNSHRFVEPYTEQVWASRPAADRAGMASPLSPYGSSPFRCSSHDAGDFEVNAPTNPHLLAFEASVREQIVDDVTQIIQRVPYIERYQARLFEPGLLSELAEASDRLAAKVADLQEAQGATR